jgi:hypothetical protein
MSARFSLECLLQNLPEGYPALLEVPGPKTVLARMMREPDKPTTKSRNSLILKHRQNAVNGTTEGDNHCAWDF